jgi:hypothetical protein
MKKLVAFVTGFSLLILCALAPIDAAAQGRGNGRGNHPGGNSKRDWKKSRKFVNGHDARDGKWGKPGKGRGRHKGHGHHRH